MARRPPTFHDFIGQKESVDLLRRVLGGAQSRQRSFPHSLFHGSSGLGKTLLATALATELGTGCVITRGQLSREELVPKFTSLKINDIVFVDEAHLLKSDAVDLLLEAIDELRVTPATSRKAKSDDKAKETDLNCIEIAPFTVLLATDQPGALANALQKRMTMQVSLRPYRIEELKEIAEQIATKCNMLISPQAAKLLAQAAHGLPRTVRHFLEGIHFFFPEAENRQLSVADIKEFLCANGIDERGFGKLHRQYLDYLRKAGSASLQSLALHLQTDCDFVRGQIEPVLLSHSLIKIGTSGRELTNEERDQSEHRNEATEEEASDYGNG